MNSLLTKFIALLALTLLLGAALIAGARLLHQYFNEPKLDSSCPGKVIDVIYLPAYDANRSSHFEASEGHYCVSYTFTVGGVAYSNIKTADTRMQPETYRSAWLNCTVYYMANDPRNNDLKPEPVSRGLFMSAIAFLAAIFAARGMMNYFGHGCGDGSLGKYRMDWRNWARGMACLSIMAGGIWTDHRFRNFQSQVIAQVAPRLLRPAESRQQATDGKTGEAVNLPDSKLYLLEARDLGKTLTKAGMPEKSTSGKFVLVKYQVTWWTASPLEVVCTPKLVDSQGRKFSQMNDSMSYLPEGQQLMTVERWPSGVIKTFHSIYEVAGDSQGLCFQAQAANPPVKAASPALATSSEPNLRGRVFVNTSGSGVWTCTTRMHFIDGYRVEMSVGKVGLVHRYFFQGGEVVVESGCASHPHYHWEIRGDRLYCREENTIWLPCD